MSFSKLIRSLLLLSLAGCAFGYKVKDVDKAIARNDRQLDRLDSTIGADLKNQSKIVECFAEAPQPGSESEIAALKNKLSQLESLSKEIQKSREALLGKMAAVKKSERGKKMILSNDPAFPEYKKNLKAIETDSAALQKTVDAYSKISKSLYADAKDKKLLLIDFNTLESDLDKSATTTEKTIGEAQKQINDAKKKIAASDVKSKSEKLAALEKMTGLLSDASVEAQEARKTGKNLAAQFPAKGLICLAPQNPSYAYINDLNAHADKISKIGKELKTLGAGVNKK
jgi:hypothetical protein